MHNGIQPGVSSRKNNVSIKVDRRGIKRWFDASLFYPLHTDWVIHSLADALSCTLPFHGKSKVHH